MSTVEEAARVASLPPVPAAVPDSFLQLRRRIPTIASLYHPNYRLLWVGTCFMSAGQWIQQVTLGWLIYDMTGSPAMLGILGAVRTLPFLIVSPTAGVMADRMDRQTLVIRAEWFLVFAAMVMGALVATGTAQVWHLFVFTITTGVAWAFNQPARMALVPATVPREDLMNAVALNSFAFNIAKVVGPFLGGVLIANFGPGGNFFVQAAAYAAVIVMIYLMSVAPQAPVAAQSAFSGLREGFAYVRAAPAVAALLLLSLIPAILVIPYISLMPVFAKDVLGVGPEGLGLLLAAPGVGAVASTLLLATIARNIRHMGRFLLASLVLVGIFLMLFSRTTTLPGALLALTGVGAFHIFLASATNTILQQIVPDELRGRIMSLYMLDIGLAPFGVLLGGVATQFFGAPFTMMAMGVGTLIFAGLVAWRMPQVRQLST